MRFKSAKTGGYVLYALTGTHTVSFAIDHSEADKKGLLGFSVEREDSKERYYLDNLKVFEELVHNPKPNVRYSSYQHPIQSFVWDDFTAKPGETYTYYFYPIKGKPKKLDRSAKPVVIKIQMEDFNITNEHNIYFNRGVASSQAYATKFDNENPSNMDKEKQMEAMNWLSRGLDKAILDFIEQAKKGDKLRAALYEFRYQPVADAFKAAIKRGVDVKIIYDAKVNEHYTKDKKGKQVFNESFPREDNKRVIRKAGISKNCIAREANETHIHHNKFIVYYKGKKPTSVWTGSTNISEGGIFGQTNVGHWIRNAETAEKYIEYWELLSGDPGAVMGEDKSKRTKDNNAYKDEVVAITNDIEYTGPDCFTEGITPVFSPRRTLSFLNCYAAMVDTAQHQACVTLAFGVNKLFKELLKDNLKDAHLIFLLLEKEDKANAKSKSPFVPLGSWNNIYQSFGNYLEEPLYQWARETSTRGLKLNSHVAYIHSKFLLMDPLSADPVVVTGSANFSDASTKDNDENMVIIRGNTRVADIYYTEFMRLFNHYYFRSIYNKLRDQQTEEEKKSGVFIDTTPQWLEKYKPGTLRDKKIKAFIGMAGAKKMK